MNLLNEFKFLWTWQTLSTIPIEIYYFPHSISLLVLPVGNRVLSESQGKHSRDPCMGGCGVVRFILGENRRLRSGPQYLISSVSPLRKSNPVFFRLRNMASVQRFCAMPKVSPFQSLVQFPAVLSLCPVPRLGLEPAWRLRGYPHVLLGPHGCLGEKTQEWDECMLWGVGAERVLLCLADGITSGL